MCAAESGRPVSEAGENTEGGGPDALCCAVTPAGSCRGRDQDRVEGLLRAGGVVAVGLG